MVGGGLVITTRGGGPQKHSDNRRGRFLQEHMFSISSVFSQLKTKVLFLQQAVGLKY